MSNPSDRQVGSPGPPGGEDPASSRPGSRLERETPDKPEGIPFLLYRDGSGAQRVHLLEADRAVTIGRGDDSDVHLWWDLTVSLVHAEAVRVGSHWLISDDGVSRNGTFVNDQRLSGRRRLRHRDVIRVGATALVFNDARAERRGATTIADAPSATGTVTLLFTDLVGSTELIDGLGEGVGERLLLDHFAILRRAAREHGGREVKSLGDGLMVAFTSALGAVACAVKMQQRIAAYRHEHAERAMGLRIGLNAGEVISVDDDYFGAPVVVAARLCDRADAAQILLSDLVRSLVGDRGGYRFLALGTLQLKGLTDPVTAFSLDWRSQAEPRSSLTRAGHRSDHA
jgi:class 3 adenylate cyclase